jgi:hypothetical protein
LGATLIHGSLELAPGILQLVPALQLMDVQEDLGGLGPELPDHSSSTGKPALPAIDEVDAGGGEVDGLAGGEGAAGKGLGEGLACEGFEALDF